MNTRIASLLIITSVLCLEPGVALSGMYKCVNLDGQVTYSQLPCANEDENSDLRVSKSSIADAKVCGEVGQFVVKVVNSMRQQRDAPDVIEEYGGLDGISKGALSIINYVYSFKSSKQISADRIANLSVTKCKNNAFGNLTYGDIPGAIDPDSEEALHLKIMQEQQAAFESARETMEPESTEISGDQIDARSHGVVTPNINQSVQIMESQNQRLCGVYQRQLESIDAQMRGGYSAAEGEGLRESRRDLRDKIRQYCQ